MKVGNESNTTVHELLLPTLLFASLGGMSWAVRGCSGYGGSWGCLFAGTLWGSAWYFLSREGKREKSRRYSLGWSVLAISMGMFLAGGRGWMQWSHWFDGRLYTNWTEGRFVSINPFYGWLWLFVAGIPWAGLGAVLLAWCGSKRPITWKGLLLRLGLAVAAYKAFESIFNQFPEVFLPLYDQVDYRDWTANPNLKRVINDLRAATIHLGVYLTFLGFEVLRRDWRNVKLIAVVGFVNGIGWACLQNWTWAKWVWPEAQFNWWRCWESSAGISIGIAYGLAFYICNRPLSQEEKRTEWQQPYTLHPTAEKMAVYFALIVGSAFNIKNGLKGFMNLYVCHEAYWVGFFERWGMGKFDPDRHGFLAREDWWSSVFLVLVVLPAVLLFFRLLRRRLAHPYPQDFEGDTLPRYTRFFGIVLVIHNILAQMVTGPHNWTETVFSIYYVLLFLITAVLVHHYICLRRLGLNRD